MGGEMLQIQNPTPDNFGEINLVWPNPEKSTPLTNQTRSSAIHPPPTVNSPPQGVDSFLGMDVFLLNVEHVLCGWCVMMIQWYDNISMVSLYTLMIV